MAGRRADALQRPRYIPRSNPRVRSCEELRGTAEHDRGVKRSVWNGAKRRRRSRWERDARERVARGGVRLLAGAGGPGYFHEGRLTHVERARQLVAGARRNIKGPTDTNTNCPSRDKPGTCRDVDKELDGKNGPSRRRAGRFVQSGRTTFFPVPVLRTSTTGRTVTFLDVGCAASLQLPGMLHVTHCEAHGLQNATFQAFAKY